MSGPSLPALLSRLEAAGVRLALSEDGQGVRVLGRGRPSPELLSELRAQKGALLAFLRGEGKGAQGVQTVDAPAPAEVSPPLPSPDLPHAGPLADLPDLEGPQARQGTRPAPTPEEWAAEAAKPGRCGSCAKWTPNGYYLEGACGADPGAWWPLSPPFAVHIGAKCGAYLRPGQDVGEGYRRKEAGKRYGPLAVLPAASLPADFGGRQ